MVFYLYFWKKIHKYYIMHGTIYGNIGGEKAWLRKKNGNGKMRMKKKIGKKNGRKRSDK
jgi:hypothetical protein